MKEIPGSNKLISLQHHYDSSANIAIFDLTKKGRSEKIYSFDKVIGCKFAISKKRLNRFFTTNLFNINIKNNNFLLALDTGWGDLTYNTKRNLLGAISLSGRISYHLFFVDTTCLNIKESIKLLRKSKWDPKYANMKGKFIILII